MADPSPLVTPQAPDDTSVYRPISGFAVAGLALSGLYTALVVISAIMRFFWPNYISLLAILGISLSVVALWQIRRAEGTRAGLKVAQWGLWLGLLSGGGYVLYHAVTILAVKMQANRFLMEAGEDSGFFPRLLEGDINRAYLLTMPSSQRGNVNPDDEQAMAARFDAIKNADVKGRLTSFREDSVLRAWSARSGHAETPLAHAGSGELTPWVEGDGDPEITPVRVAWLRRSEYEYAQHVVMARAAGMTEGEVAAIPEGPDAAVWGPEDAVVLRAVDQLCDARYIADDVWAELCERFDRRQVMDLLFTVGAYDMLATALANFGVELDPGAEGFTAEQQR